MLDLSASWLQQKHNMHWKVMSIAELRSCKKFTTRLRTRSKPWLCWPVAPFSPSPDLVWYDQIFHEPDMPFHQHCMDKKAGCLKYKNNAWAPNWGIHERHITHSAWGLENKQRQCSTTPLSNRATYEGIEAHWTPRPQLHGAHLATCKCGMINLRAVTDVIEKLMRYATHFHHSILTKQHLRNIQRGLCLPQHNIIQAVPTRWNSTLHRLQRMLEQKSALTIYSGEQGGFTALTAEQGDLVSKLNKTPLPIKEVTLQVRHSNSSASCIILSLTVLKMFQDDEGPSTKGIRILK